MFCILCFVADFPRSFPSDCYLNLHLHVESWSLLAYSHVGLHSTDMSTISALPLFPVLLVLVVAFIARVIWSQYQYNKKYKFPNVVPGWPVLGSTLDVPLRAGMWGVDNAKKYGEM